MKINVIHWVFNNKLLTILALATFCLFISTMALTVKNERLTKAYDTTPKFNSHNSIISSEDNNFSFQEKISHYRLSKNIKPLNYKLKLVPDILDKTFEGKAEILLNISEPTKTINMHTKDLSIHSVSLRDSGNNQKLSVLSTKILVGLNLEIMEINLKNALKQTQVILLIKFSGRMDKTIIGFYSSTLKNGGAMVASKFQPTYARQAFPCFDEPEFKATYDITLVKPVSYVALSNMNEISKTISEDKKTESVSFATSVPMSTYLACFVVCDFNFKEVEIQTNGIGNNFKLRSFAQKDQMHKIDFAQDIGNRATEFYIKYYEVPFPLPKLDMIAIPDYVSGATEHWGLITYRETSFLVDEATASAKNKISVANTIAHELAHMWFGNLVTMKWWDEVWLNEGFASYMQVKALNAIEPSWTMLDQFLTKTLHSVLVTDAKLSSHPIVQTVETPDQITAIFDTISYNKGASVLRMLEGFIGEENFRLGVSDYLKKYKFGNTVTQDLLYCLEPYFKKENPKLNLSYVMDTWTKQMGYPLLTVEQSEEPDTYIISQSRFLLDSGAVQKNDSEFNYRWFVPITYQTNIRKYQEILWFADTADTVKLKLREGESWLKINNNQVGFYRVNYPLSMWNKLLKQLKKNHEQLTISDRAHLLNDVFALAEARKVSYELALNLTTYLTEERDYVPWDTAASVFAKLSDRLLNSMAHDNLQKYVTQLVAPLYERQSWLKTDLTVIEGLLRSRILSLATSFGLPDAEAKVRGLFVSWLNAHGTPEAVVIEPDLRDFVYYYGDEIGFGGGVGQALEYLFERRRRARAGQVEICIGSAGDSNLLRRYLTLAWDESNIRSQDYLNVVHYISANPSGTSIVWDDVRSRWPQLVERFTLNSRYLGSLVPGITSSFDTQNRLEEMEAWFAKYPEAGAGESARRRALETVKNNIQWAVTQKAERSRLA